MVKNETFLHTCQTDTSVIISPSHLKYWPAEEKMKYFYLTKKTVNFMMFLYFMLTCPDTFNLTLINDAKRLSVIPSIFFKSSTYQEDKSQNISEIASQKMVYLHSLNNLLSVSFFISTCVKTPLISLQPRISLAFLSPMSCRLFSSLSEPELSIRRIFFLDWSNNDESNLDSQFAPSSQAGSRLLFSLPSEIWTKSKIPHYKSASKANCLNVLN